MNLTILPAYFTYIDSQPGCARTPTTKYGVKILIFKLDAQTFFVFFVRISTIYFCNRKLVWHVLRYAGRPIFEGRWVTKIKYLCITKKVLKATTKINDIFEFCIPKNINIWSFINIHAMVWLQWIKWGKITLLIWLAKTSKIRKNNLRAKRDSKSLFISI